MVGLRGTSSNYRSLEALWELGGAVVGLGICSWLEAQEEEGHSQVVVNHGSYLSIAVLIDMYKTFHTTGYIDMIVWTLV